MIKLRCKCGAEYEVDQSLAGQKCQCDSCGKKFFIPSPPDNPEEIVPAMMVASSSTPKPNIEKPANEKVIPPSQPPASNEGARPRQKRQAGVPESPSARRTPRQTQIPKKNSSSKLIPAAIVLIILGAGAWFFFMHSPIKKHQTRKISLLTDDNANDDKSVANKQEVIENNDEEVYDLTKGEPEEYTDQTPTDSVEEEPDITIPPVSTKPPQINAFNYEKLTPVQPPKKSLVAYFPFDESLTSKIGGESLKNYPQNKKPVYIKGVSGKAIKLHSKGTNNLTFPDSILNSDAGTINLWVRVNDDFSSMWGKPILSAKNQNGKDIEVLSWDEHRCEFKSNFSDKKFLSTLGTYYLPDRHEWVNLTVTWDKSANKRALYVNGRCAIAFGSMKMPEDGSCITSNLALRVWPFLANSTFDADEIRLYNQALTPKEIKWLVLKHHPIEIKLQDIASRARVVYGKPGSIAHVTTKVKLMRKSPYQAKLKLETKDASDKVLWKKTVTVALNKKGETKPLTWNITIPKKDTPVYLSATLVSKESTPVWGVKTTCIPTTYEKGKRGEGLPYKSFKKVYSVNCTVKPNPSTFYSNKPTKVVKSKYGSYRESSWEPFTVFAYTFKVKNPGKLHVLRAFYPDNKPRVFALDINDGSGHSPQGAGILTGLMTELTGKMQKQDCIFYPETKNCLLIVCNWSTDCLNRGSVIPFKPKTGAALAKFEVFEVNSKKLPQLPITKNETDRGRSIGGWVEDAGQTAFWGTPKDDAASIEGWIISTQNMAEYMDFVGINEYQYPVVWYDGPLFNCPTLFKFNDLPVERIHSHQVGAFDVMLRIFQKHHIKFFPAIYFRNLLALYGQADTKLPSMFSRKFTEEVWNQRYKGEHPAGKDVFQYLRNGKHRMRPYDTNGLPGATAGVGPVFNPLHPSVNKLIMGIYKEWLEQYANYPALGGVLLDMGLTWGGVPQADSYSFDRLDSGYGDFTISLFEKDTKIKVPGDKDDPQRFEKRYKFLTSGSMKKKWIKWRCEQIRDKVIMPLYKMIRKYNPKLVVQLGVGSRNDVGNKILNKKRTWNESALECGIDVTMYKGLKNLEFVRHGASFQNPTKCYPLDNLDNYWPNPGAFPDCGAMTISSSYWEMFDHGDLVNPIRKKWPKVNANQLPVRIMTDAREGALARTSYALMKDDLQSIYMTGVAGYPTYGHEDIVIPFFKAFRALPRKRFSDVPGLSDPVRVRQLTTKGKSYIYLINADSEQHKVTLNFKAPPGEGIDLRNDNKINFTKNTCKIKVPPYQLVALKFFKPVTISSGSTATSDAEMKKLKEQYAAIIKAGQLPHTPEKKGKAYIGFEAEDFANWPKKERYFITNPSQKIPQNLKSSVSGGGAIGFGGGSAPVEYKLKFPRTGKYTLWVKFAMPEANKTPSKWKMTINGKELPKIESPAKGHPLWVKAGVVNIGKTNVDFTFAHATVAYSIMVDAFLFTNDSSYVPKGGVDYKKKMAAFNKNLASLRKAMKEKHIAELKALMVAVKAMYHKN